MKYIEHRGVGLESDPKLFRMPSPRIKLKTFAENFNQLEF